MAPQDGNTALMKAAAGGHRDTVELLLDRGADVQAKDEVSSARMMPLRGRVARRQSRRAANRDGSQGCDMAGSKPACGEREVAPVSCREAGGAVVVEGTCRRRLATQR